mmetsp:Transcript_119443/g.166635  ORF Transcript_119443/g.166635 Transcript_119443/m.166635 type:complete len:103 (+) Transcript_119443:707-1015(+)
MYISAGVYMVIENFEPENLSRPYTFDLCIYFIFVTISTVGYGDYYPKTDYGKIFISGLIISVLLIMLPLQTTELFYLMGLKSVYERDNYKANPEIFHVVITG